MKYRKRIVAAALCIALLGIIGVNLAGGSVKVQATDLMKGVSTKSVNGKTSDDAFISSSANFAVQLFKETVGDNKNSLISPLSVMLALSRYIDEGNTTGFIKNYKDSKYSFVALLPNKDISIRDYIASLTGESLLSTIKKAQNTSVMAELPKFSYEYSYVMNDALKKLGMKTAFDPDANFSKICKLSDGSISISEVLHKTYISVDELGTKAGAATKVEMRENSALIAKSVVLNRPFVYVIIDNSTNLPIFIGTVLDI